VRAAAIVALAGTLATGCVTYERGTIAVAAATVPPLETTVVAEAVEGRACGDFFAARYELAVEDALERAEGANALANVTYRFEQLCIVVRGTAVRLP
jgi:hypothetical protein